MSDNYNNVDIPQDAADVADTNDVQVLATVPGKEELATKSFDSPFAISNNSNESVILNQGTLQFSNTLLSLPGLAGMDLNLTLEYNSGDAVINEPLYSVSNSLEINVKLRPFCQIFGIGVNWQPKDEIICLETPKATTSEFNFNLSEEAALQYANVIFQDVFQEKFSEMEVLIAHDGEMIKSALERMTEKVPDPDQYYFAYCWQKDYVGASYALVFKKSDGQIIELLQE